MSSPRLLLDADTRKLLARSLRDAGFDAVHVAELGLAEEDDAVILAAGAAQGRTVYTHNARDYMTLATLWADARRAHSGILLSTQGEFPVLRRRLLRFLAKRSAEDLRDVAQWLP